MNLKDIYNKFTSKPAPNKADYRSFINEQQQYRYTKDIADFKQALMSAESLFTPNRQLLYNIYNDAINDPHLFATSQSRKINALSHSFKVTRNGKDDEDATALFANKKWFQDVLEYAQDAKLWGYSLVKFEGVDNGTIAGVSLVPRQHVKPQHTLVVKNPSDTNGLDYTTAPYSSWYLGIGQPTDLGLLCKVAPLIILKTHVVANWTQFLHLFGMPLRVGYTDLTQPEKVKNMNNFLRDMSSAAYAVMDTNDKVEMGDVVTGDGMSYENFVRFVDEQVSKVLLGGTMTADNGSSRSQSEVHERVAESYSEYDLRNIEFMVNDGLIPLMINLGFDLTNCTFQFYEKEDTVALFDMTVKLMQSGYDIDNAWLKSKFNIPVIGKAAPAAPDPNANFQKPE
jgi:phage gp29-like protein